MSALATLSSCSKDSETLGVKWTCTYNKQFYGHFSENQYVGTVWNFSNEVADDDLDYYYLYINGIKVGSYSLNTYGNFYVIEERSIEHTVYTEIVEYLNGVGLDIKGNTLEHLDYAGNPIITWSKGSGSGSGTSGGGSGSGTSGGGSGSGTSGGGHHGGGTGKSASSNVIGNWNSSYATAAKAHSLMFSEGEDAEIQ